MNVLVIPEDFRKDQYILKPIIAAMLNALGKPQARITVCQDPLLGGISEALKWENIDLVLRRYPMVDLFILCVDRDGVKTRIKQLAGLEQRAGEYLPAGKCFVAENAWQELEVWILAGLDDIPREWDWRDIRAERNPKETYYLPHARRRGVISEPGEGRRTLSQESARRYSRLKQLCPEDIANLEERIREKLS